MTLVAPPAPEGTRPGPRPTLSVVIAAYQAAALVPDAVRSALDQTLPPLDVVVCDDGSTDDPAAALAPFRDRITLLRQDNRGEAAAKNAASRAASGDFVAILDADDVFVPERLEAIAGALAERPDLDILTTDAWIELDGRRVRKVYEQGYRFPAQGQRSAILRGNFVFGLCAVRRSTLLAAGGYDESIRYATDWDLWLRLVLEGSTVGCLMTPLATYRLQRGSLSSQRSRMLAGRTQILEKTALRTDLTAPEREQLGASLREHRSRYALARAREALTGGEPQARRLALAAAVGRGQSPPARLKLAAGAVAPKRVGRALRRRPVETTAGLLVTPAEAAGAPTDPAAPRP
jgi:Glycosyl transferase family 2